jgi:endonuclease/exonuclease/phosphatase family metal-dependent hydrolase
MAWNTLDALNNEERAPKIVEKVDTIAPDIAFFSEAYSEGVEGYVPNVAKAFKDRGYGVVNALYHDDDNRKDRHGFMALYHERLGHVDADVIRLAGRNAVEMRIAVERNRKATKFIGVHLDDRLETTRRRQVQSIAARLADMQSPQIVAGDLNTMHRSSQYGWLLRSIGIFTPIIPVINPGETASNRISQKVGRVGSLATRLAQMANGGAIAELEMLGLRDVDPTFQPTIPSEKPKFQLDHVMISHHFGSDSSLLVLDHDSASDHRAIVADLHYR